MSNGWPNLSKLTLLKDESIIIRRFIFCKGQHRTINRQVRLLFTHVHISKVPKSMSALAECVLTCFAFIVRSFTSSRFNFPFISGTPSSFSRRGPSPAQKSAMLRPKSFLDGQETYPFKLLERMAVKIHQ